MSGHWENMSIRTAAYLSACSLFLVVFPLTDPTVSFSDAQMELACEMRTSFDLEGSNASLSDRIVENQGQLANDDVLFYTEGPFRAGFCRDSVIFVLDHAKGDMVETFSYRMVMVGSKCHGPEGFGQSKGSLNFIYGDRTVSGVRSFTGVRYAEVQEGIDLVFNMSSKGLKYDLLGAPFSDVRGFRFRFEGIERVEAKGDELKIWTPFGAVSDKGLISYQSGRALRTTFKIEGNFVGFEIDCYDITSPIVIDPYLEYSTFLGGSSYDQTEGTIDHDSEGNIVIGGVTTSLDFPTTQGALDRKRGKDQTDIFISKLSPDLGSLVYSTYLGGDFIDTLSGLVIDVNDSIYLTGQTYSLDFPTTEGAFDRTGQYEEPPHNIPLGDLFVSKLSPNGSALEYSTFLGGNRQESNPLLDVDDEGCTYIVGSTSSSDFPLKDAYRSDNVFGGTLLFLTKFDLLGSKLVYSTYFGGSTGSGEWPTAFKVDDLNRPVFVGVTWSLDYPVTEGAYSKDFTGSQMGFLTRFYSNGSAPEVSTFISTDMIPYGMSIDENGYFITGNVWSDTLPVHEDAADRSFSGPYDGFVLYLALNCSALPFGTYIGSKGTDRTKGISLGRYGDVLVTGFTESGNLTSAPGSDLYPYKGTGDGFLLRLSKDLSLIEGCWYIGGTQRDEVNGHVLTNGTNAYLSGCTSSLDFPTTEGAFDRELEIATPYDVFVTKFHLTSNVPSVPMDPAITWGNRFLNVTWSPPRSDGNRTVLSYNIYRNSSSGLLRVGEVVAGRPWFLDHGLMNGIEYRYRISAKNIVGEGGQTKNITGMPASRPSSPTVFTGSDGDRETTLEWGPPEDDGGFSNYTYNLYYGTIQGKMFLLWSGSNGTRYHHAGLTNGHQAYYCVKAVNWVGEGPPSQTIQLYPMGRPSKPLDLITTVGDGVISILWLPPKDLGGDLLVRYNIYWSREGQPFEVLERELYETKFLLSGLPNGMPIHFAVSANNSQGEGPLSDIVIAVPIGLPSAPRDLTLRSDDGSFRIRWIPPEDTGGAIDITYLVYVGDKHQEVILTEKAQNLTEMVINGVRNGFQYTVWVTAWNSMGEGQRSGVRLVVPYGKPSSPLNLTGTYQNGSITLEWDQPEDLGGFDSASYEIYLGISKDRLRFTCESDENTVTIGNLTNGVRYYVQVRAENPVGKGLFSNIFSITPLGPPEAPILWKAKEGNSSIELAWIEPAILGGSIDLTYSIYLWHGHLRPTMPYVNDVEGKEYIIDGLINGVEYNVAVSGVTTGGEGPISNVLTAIPLTLPGKPQNCEVVQKGGVVILSWGPPWDTGGSNITVYTVYRSTDGIHFQSIATKEPSDRTFMDTNIVNGSVYYYSVSATNRVGEGERSLVVKITTRSQEDSEQQDISLLVVVILVAVAVLFILIFLVLKKGRVKDRA